MSIRTMDYSWKSPSTYLAFVPGVSLLIQRVNRAKAEQYLGSSASDLSNDRFARHLRRVTLWHLAGALTTGAVACVAVKSRVFPRVYPGAVLAVGLLSLIQTAYTLLTARKITLYGFHTNGNVQSITLTITLNPFA